MHKLCRIEAERVNAVLQETMESLQILSFVPPQVRACKTRETHHDDLQFIDLNIPQAL